MIFNKGQLLKGYFSSVDVPVLNYNSDSDDVKMALFETELDFVLIQDSGEVICQQDSLTPECFNQINKVAGMC